MAIRALARRGRSTVDPVRQSPLPPGIVSTFLRAGLRESARRRGAEAPFVWNPNHCRFRSERVPLFRASGDHLSGCGAIRLTMLRDRANSPAWLAPARWLRGVAIGGPRPKRCPVEHPRDVTVELLAQRDGSLEEAQPGRRGVQIQLITT